MTDDQINSFVERFVLSFEKIAAALDGLNETHQKQYHRQYPERREVREAIVTRVQTEDDRIREAQGASGQSVDAWLSLYGEEEDEEPEIGAREREWLEDQKH